jgi:hypothetical protein
MRTRIGWISNSNHKKKQEHDMCKTRIQYDFITKTKQNQNKVMTIKRTEI